MFKILVLILILYWIISAQNQIFIIKVVDSSRLENKDISEVIASKFLESKKFYPVIYNAIGIERVANSNNYMDSGSICNLIDTLSKAQLFPSYILFYSVFKNKSEYSVSIRVVDTEKISIFGIIIANIPTIEYLHSSEILSNLIKKISLYALKGSQVY